MRRVATSKQLTVNTFGTYVGLAVSLITLGGGIWHVAARDADLTQAQKDIVGLRVDVDQLKLPRVRHGGGAGGGGGGGGGGMRGDTAASQPEDLAGR